MWWKLLGSIIVSLIGQVDGSVVSNTPTPNFTAPSSTTVNATCPSRTANIITHNLPQQCLTASRRGTNVTSTLIATDVESVAEATRVSIENVSTESNATASVATATTVKDDTTEDPPTVIPPSTLAVPSLGPSSIDAIQGSDEASPLDDGKFMSFEDWKKENLRQAGQSEHIGRDKPVDQLSQRKRPTNIHTALDTLGDDAEIELDFSGFLPDAPDISRAPRSAASNSASDSATTDQTGESGSAPPVIRSRGKDAGTTCKERFNYASFDCAANVLKTNAEAMSPSAVLGENKDSYMLNVCSANNKFLILELCDDISIDTVVLANYEFFSSIFRTFRVSVSDKYPVKADKWKTLGEFEARNSRNIQAFLIPNPVIWARYVRIEFLSHYGNEYYCPVSLVRVHGTTMLEDYKHGLDSLQGDHDDESEAGSTDLTDDEALVPEAIAEPPKQTKSTSTVDVATEDSASISPTGASPNTSKTEHAVEIATLEAETVSSGSTCNFVSTAKPSLSTSVSTGRPSMPSTHSNASMVLQAGTIEAMNTTSSASERVNVTDTVTNSSAITDGNKTGSVQNSTTVANLTIPSSSSSASTNVTASDRPKTLSSGTATQSPAAMPTMQESFFKSVQKRLAMLESNSSLSLQYIEDQSRALRDAFTKVEQRQLAKTSTFLDHLNVTVLSELREFRQQYDQLWQSTVIELEVQRERYHQETEAMNARLSILTTELIYQKRLSMLQMAIVLICLALVVFSRGAFNQYLELPLVQSVLARSPSSRWLNNVSLDTPTQSPPVTRQNSARKRGGILKGHRRMQSEDSADNSLSPIDYSPPTPTSMSMSYEDGLEIESRAMQSALDDPDFDPSSIERPSTSPPELQTTLPPSPEATDVSDHESIGAILHDSTPERQVPIPRVMIEHATPPPKQLSWNLPDNDRPP